MVQAQLAGVGLGHVKLGSPSSKSGLARNVCQLHFGTGAPALNVFYGEPCFTQAERTPKPDTINHKPDTLNLTS
jgi:hypothetical protein